MRTYIYFIRHGECLSNLDSSFNGPEDSLSEAGQKQAVAVAERFRHIAINALYHSGILRAQKTAEEIEKVTGIHPEVKEFLKERRGAFLPDGAYGYTEDFETFKSRLAETCDFLEQSSAKRIVVVGHAIFLKALAAFLIQGTTLTEQTVENFDKTLVMDNTGISKCIFNTETKSWRIMSWNDLAHLAE